MTPILHVVVIALYALPATAVPLPNIGHLFHHAPSVVQAPRANVTFHNESIQPRELHVGADSFALAGRSDLRLSVTIGSEVHVSSSMNSHINGTLLTVTPAAAKNIVNVK